MRLIVIAIIALLGCLGQAQEAKKEAEEKETIAFVIRPKGTYSIDSAKLGEFIARQGFTLENVIPDYVATPTEKDQTNAVPNVIKDMALDKNCVFRWLQPICM
jgi:hypothetical protein